MWHCGVDADDGCEEHLHRALRAFLAARLLRPAPPWVVTAVGMQAVERALARVTSEDARADVRDMAREEIDAYTRRLRPTASSRRAAPRRRDGMAPTLAAWIAGYRDRSLAADDEA